MDWKTLGGGWGVLDLTFEVVEVSAKDNGELYKSCVLRVGPYK